MSQILKDRQSVRTESSGMTCTVKQFLGGGGQGEVYEAILGDKSVALKWYFPASATPEQRSSLEILVRKGAPSNKFLWPEELASVAGVDGFGYVMPLRQTRYKGIVDMMKRRIDPSFRALATAGLNLSDGYLQLHAKGLCYRDISFGNAFFDPDNGDVLICDNDNVSVDKQAPGSILGTPRFMAPEVVRGEAVPSTQTDLFSLSVLLFYMFMIHHPLEGKKELAIKCLDLPAMNRLYGAEPLFIFDPNDHSNEPSPIDQKNPLLFWPIYPAFLRKLFTQAFTDGVRDPAHGRVRESQWRGAMVQLRDSIVYCPSCGLENFCDIEAMKASGGIAPVCWSCHKDVRLPARIRIRGSVIMLNHDTQLYPHHIDDQRSYDFSGPIAAMTQHPTNPGVWGLRNLSSEKWVGTAADGTVRDIEPGRSMTLGVGAKINFGKSEGEIRV